MYGLTFLHILDYSPTRCPAVIKISDHLSKINLINCFGKHSGLRRLVPSYSLNLGHAADDTVVWRRFSPSKDWKCWQHKVNEHRETRCTGTATGSQGQEYWNCVKSYNTMFKNQWQFTKGWRQSFKEVTNFNFILKKSVKTLL